MAYSNKKVILVDLDMRKPKGNGTSTFDDRTRGVSTILIRKNSWQECLAKTPLENFDFLPSGPHPPNPSELLLNGGVRRTAYRIEKSLRLHYSGYATGRPGYGWNYGDETI